MSEEQEIKYISFSAMTYQGATTALIVIAGTAWTDAMQAAVKKTLPAYEEGSLLAPFLHACILTMCVSLCLRIASFRSDLPPGARRVSRTRRRRDGFKKVPSETIIASASEMTM